MRVAGVRWEEAGTLEDAQRKVVEMQAAIKTNKAKMRNSGALSAVPERDGSGTNPSGKLNGVWGAGLRLGEVREEAAGKGE